MTPTRRAVVPASGGRAFTIDAHEEFAIVDLQGAQVADLFVLVAGEDREHLSASHTRAYLSRLFPEVGEVFVSNQRRPILRLTGDTSPGMHDMLIAACDPARYAALGAVDHPSCAQNWSEGLDELGLPAQDVPQPVNIFMAAPLGPDGGIAWETAPSRAGDRFALEALVDLAIVVSACPQDLVPINGGHPTELAVEIG